jgi:hypothetical protein
MNVRLNKFVWLTVIALGPASIWLACGGSSAVDLAVGDGGAGEGSADGAIANDGALSTGDSSADGSTQDGGAPADAGPGGNLTSLPCGAATCAIPLDRCCVYPVPNPPPDFSYLCATGGGCPDAGGGANKPTELTCSGAANCPAGTVCCVVDMNNLVSSACRAACNPGGGNDAQLCDPAASPTGCAADAGRCSNKNIGDWGLANSFGTCGGVAH